VNSAAMTQDQRNIIITGFMGTGKTAVGRVVAARLNRSFVDMDAVLEQRIGASIPEIFAQHGERFFRLQEAALCRELAEQEGLVIATGGGALVSRANRDTMTATGIVICLTASLDELMRRLETAEDRPLLATDDRRERIASLMRERAAAYAAMPHRIDTTGLTVEEVAEQVLAIARGEGKPGWVIPVRYPGGQYEILLGEELLARAGQLLVKQGLTPGVAAIVTNPTVGGHYAATLREGLEAAGFQPLLCEVPDGEEYKTLDTVRTLYDRFVATGLDRRSSVIALGGGVVGDLAGFAAATYLRGVPFVQIPTSLLAMVDASVGGKVGVDLPQGKNLVGAFKQPAAVIVDPRVLKTLPSEEFRSGLAEVVKHGIIGAPALFRQLEGTGPESLAAMIADAIRVKVAVVEEDPFEQGRRAVLNLGHTFGHALELISGYRLRHGDAVGIGLVAAARLACRLEHCSEGLAQRIEQLVERLGLPVRYEDASPEAIYTAMATDKKRRGRRLRFVLPKALGQVTIVEEVRRDHVLAVLQTIRSF